MNSVPKKTQDEVQIKLQAKLQNPFQNSLQNQNQLQFVASITEREILRYTPAGIPIVSAVLQHSSEQIEAGVQRLVGFEISALAAGEISGRFNLAELGGTFRFTGFLARKNRNSKSLVFHITDFETPIQIHEDTGA